LKSSPPKGRRGTASEAGEPPDPQRLLRRKRWFRIIALVVPLVNLGLLELILRLAGYGYPADFFLRARVNGRPAFVDNQQFARRYFPAGLERTPRPLVLAADKQPGTLRVFVFGESAAMGDPEPAFGFARILEELLRDAFPGRSVEVVNVAVTAINSHVIRAIARDCADKQGDYWILYMGNNEVVGPFGAGTVFGRQTPSLGFIRANLALKATRLGQLIDAIRERLLRSRTAPTTWEGMEMFLDQQVAQTDPRLAAVYSHFDANVREIVRLGQRAGAQVLLSTVASNLKDSPPFASGHRPGMTATEQTEWSRLFAGGIAAERAGTPGAALTNYTQAAAIDASYAELSFRMGRCLAALGEVAEARRRFEQARDLDRLRFRADTRLNAIVRNVATHTAGAPWVDAEAVLATNSPGGIAGSEYFHEHVHLSFSGNYLLARAFAAQIASRHGGSGTAPPSEAECGRRLAFTDEERWQVLEEVAKRLRQPPFTQQADHEEREKRLEAELALLRNAVRQPDAVASADAIFRAAVQRRPDDWTLRENYAQFLQAHGRSAEAEAEWRKLITLLPQSEHPYYGLANLLDTMGRSREAVPYFQAALQRRPGSVEVLNGLGLALASQGDVAGAVREYERALHAKPDFAEARVNLGQALARSGKETEAAAQYAEVLRLQSNNVAAHVNLGKLLAGRGRLPEAIAHYQEAVRLNPNNAVAHYNLANALNETGDTAGAVAQYAEAVRISPDLAEARYNLGLGLAKLNRPAEALPQLAEAARLRPQMAEARFNYGVALAKARRFDEAIREFQETLKLDPGNAQAGKFLEQATTLRQQGP
jgi:tetratricopeptide (TPR) repeat protein